MLGIGIGEMIVIAGIALVIIGPEKFPEFAKICVRTIRDLRSYVEEAKDDLRKEIAPLKKEIDQVKSYDPESYIDALTDSRDKVDNYSATYGHTEDQDGDYDAYDTYGAGDRAGTAAKTGSAQKEAPPGDADTQVKDETDSKDAAKPAGQGEPSAPEPAAEDSQAAAEQAAPPVSEEDDFDIPNRMDA